MALSCSRLYKALRAFDSGKINIFLIELVRIPGRTFNGLSYIAGLMLK
jgi:hypothetical protein